MEKLIEDFNKLAPTLKKLELVKDGHELSLVALGYFCREPSVSLDEAEYAASELIRDQFVNEQRKSLG